MLPGTGMCVAMGLLSSATQQLPRTPQRSADERLLHRIHLSQEGQAG
ncbi:hypothetical protein IM53_019680 [Xanthomonas phaseoli pv. dieffenbachiae]|uniref:Uncharacterized protein n=1 Tax=Xanthomonas phaseoli pv. dieffenbachiae TaxID=92828 RepID=A0A1V9GUX6_9XANT|nr:hypothetical protein IM53_019680 [Xanthomonas phaseoli pv. dieffenbachiae]